MVKESNKGKDNFSITTSDIDTAPMVPMVPLLKDLRTRSAGKKHKQYIYNEYISYGAHVLLFFGAGKNQ